MIVVDIVVVVVVECCRMSESESSDWRTPIVSHGSTIDNCSSPVPSGTVS